MPIYEYACEKCGLEFEVEQRITEEPLCEHEGCGGKVKRLISLTSFALKGKGWYSDHYGLKSNGNGSTINPKSTSAESATNGSSSESAKESKTEAAAAPKPETTTKPDSPSPNSGKAA